MYTSDQVDWGYPVGVIASVSFTGAFRFLEHPRHAHIQQPDFPSHLLFVVLQITQPGENHRVEFQSLATTTQVVDSSGQMVFTTTRVVATKGILMKVSLTDREAEYLDVLWELGPSTVAEVRTLLRDDPAYTTVLTILRKMEAKGYVKAQKEGRAHRYAALVERDAARRSALRELSAKLFKGSAELLMAHLIAEQSLSDEQIRRIHSMLDEQTENKKE